MKKWIGYQNGINLGGWLSQCCHTKEHYESFICEADVEKIASLGMDHVRLPIDYNLLQDEQGGFIEENFSYIDRCLKWCERFGLNMVLDLHKTAGFSFDEDRPEKSFFSSDELIDRFISLWNRLAERYGSNSDRMAFELLNEVVDECDNEPWMKIAERTVGVIRKKAPDIKILIGAYFNNSVLTVKDIAPPFDENIIYNFHCYEPLLFTHQGAYWVKNMPDDYRLAYPMTKRCFEAEMNANNSPIADTVWAVPEEGLGTGYFENLFREAIQIAEERGVMLYCGEYGVIDLIDTDSALAWLSDIHTVFEKYGIGRSIWTFKAKDFGITDENRRPVLENPKKYL